MRTHKIPLLLTLLTTALTVQAQAPQRNFYDYDFIRAANPWLSSKNAAGLGTLQVDRTSLAEAWFDKSDGGLIPLEGSDNSWEAGVRTKSYLKISDKIAFHGELSYSYFHGRNMGAHYFIDPDYNPVNLVERDMSTTGIKVKETFRLLGGIAYDFDQRWSIGANIIYETADYAKRKDPRTSSRWMDLDITAGLGFAPTENFSIGLNLQYIRTMEVLSGDVFGTTDQQYFTLVDYGGYAGYIEAFDGTNGYVNVGSTSAAFARPMENNIYGASLQLSFGNLSNILFFNELTYGRRTGRYGNRATTEVTYTEHNSHIIDYSGTLNINRGSALHRLGLGFSYEGLKNYENLYTKTSNEGGNTIVSYLGQQESLTMNDMSATLSYTGYSGVDRQRPKWEYGVSLEGGYRTFRATYFPYYRIQTVASIMAGLNGRRNFFFGKNIFTLGLEAGYFTGGGTKNNDGSYISTASDNYVTNQDYLDRDYEYDTAARLQGTLSLRYTRLFGTKLAAYIDLSDSYRHTLAGPEFLSSGYRNIFIVTLGCSF